MEAFDGYVYHVLSDKSSYESPGESIDRITERSKRAYKYLPGVAAVNEMAHPKAKFIFLNCTSFTRFRLADVFLKWMSIILAKKLETILDVIILRII